MNISYRDFLAIAQLLFIRGAGMLSLFLANIVIARNFGVAALGVFQLGLAWVIIMASFARLGQDSLMLRRAAEAKVQNETAAFRKSLCASLTLCAVMLTLGTILAIALINWGPWRTVIENDAWFLSLMVLAIIPTGLLMLVTEAQRGWQSVNASMMWQGSLPQTFFLVLVAVLALGIEGPVHWVAVCYVLAFCAAMLGAATSWKVLSMQSFQWPSWSDMLAVARAGWSFWLLAMLTAMIAWLDVVLLSALGDAETVGTYSAIIRTGAVMGTIVQIMSASAIAQLALLYAQSDFEAFANCFRRYFQLFCAIALPLAILALGFPAEIMSIWGAETTGSAKLFSIYAIFQLLNFALCLTGFSVVVMRLEKQLVRVQTFAFALKLGAIYLGFKEWGLSGALYGAGLSLLAFNLMSGFIFIRRLRRRGISPTSLFLWPVTKA